MRTFTHSQTHTWARTHADTHVYAAVSIGYERRNYIHHPGFNTFFDLGKTRGFILIIAAKRGSSTPRELETLDLGNMSWTLDEHFPTRRESSGARTRRMASQQQLDQGSEDQVCKCSQGEARINLARPKGLRIKTHVAG